MSPSGRCRRREFCFAVVGSLTDPAEAERLASKYEQARDDIELSPRRRRSGRASRAGLRIVGDGAEAAALNASLPWLAHDAIIHLTVPRGLEQYTGAAWGTRDVCQGPVEFLLTLEHDEPVKKILRIVFAQQYATRGDWPQWFMLEPYASIQDRHSHGDVIVWPLKALNDYLEATNDLAFLDEPVPWREDETLERTAQRDPIAVHVEKLLATMQRALHSRHASDPLRRGRLERFAATGRSRAARRDGEQLDGRVAVSAAHALRRSAAPGAAERTPPKS